MKMIYEIGRLESLLERIPGPLFPAIYGGGVVSPNTGGEDDLYYGGNLHGESMSKELVEFVCMAHRAIPVLIQRIKDLESQRDDTHRFINLALEAGKKAAD